MRQPPQTFRTCEHPGGGSPLRTGSGFGAYAASAVSHKKHWPTKPGSASPPSPGSNDSIARHAGHGPSLRSPQCWASKQPT